MSARALQPNWTRQSWEDIYCGPGFGQGGGDGGDLRYYWLRGGAGRAVVEEGRFDGHAFQSTFDPLDY